MNIFTDKSFKSLNGLRKYYLIVLWALSISAFLAVTFAYSIGSHKVSFSTVVVSGLFVGLTYWTHKAITNRKIIHLKVIAFLNLIPFLNIIGAVIVFSIIDTTRKEISS